MSSFNTAALDPIFWLHHANIDRLWELWRRQDATHTDPIEGLWLTGAPFTFHDSDRSPVTITASQMVDIQSPLLNYDYEGLPARVGAALGAAPSIGVAMRESRPIPEMVGASSTRITLGGQPSIVSLTASAPQGPAASPPGGAAATHSVHLVLENVKALDYPVESYGVYVNVREGDRAEDHPELLAGILPGFGLVEASRPDNEHGGGSGLNHSFDITPIVEDLASRSLWNPAELRVSFVPVRSEGDRVPGTETAPVQVGRVSLYYS